METIEKQKKKYMSDKPDSSGLFNIHTEFNFRGCQISFCVRLYYTLPEVELSSYPQADPPIE